MSEDDVLLHNLLTSSENIKEFKTESEEKKIIFIIGNI